jgi:hypothetical protein
MELIKSAVTNVGVCGILFLVWYFYHKAQSRAWMEQQRHQAEQARLQLETLAEQHKLQLQSYIQLIEGHRERENKNFEVMNRYAETLEYHAACLARMETKIDQNKFCPIARKESQG